MKFLIDMNMSPRWAEALCEAGHDCVHWAQLGKANEHDETIMQYAAANNCCVITRDIDFSDLLAAGGLTTPSVILHRNGERFDNRLAAELIDLIAQSTEQLRDGAVISIGRKKTRIRPLPIGRYI